MTIKVQFAELLKLFLFIFQQVAAPQLSDEDLKQLKEVCPNMDDDVIKSVFEANRGNKDATINSLLSMAAE